MVEYHKARFIDSTATGTFLGHPCGVIRTFIRLITWKKALIRKIWHFIGLSLESPSNLLDTAWMALESVSGANIDYLKKRKKNWLIFVYSWNARFEVQTGIRGKLTFWHWWTVICNTTQSHIFSHMLLTAICCVYTLRTNSATNYGFKMQANNKSTRNFLLHSSSDTIQKDLFRVSGTVLNFFLGQNPYTFLM